MNTLRRRNSMWRPALLGAALSVSLALAGLAGAPAAHTATPPSTPRTARAATPAFLDQTARALARVRGYQMTMHSSSAGYGVSVEATSTAVMVRRGTTTLFAVTAITRRAGQVSRQEEVFTGARLCLRTSARSAWSCQAEPRRVLTGPATTNAAQLAREFGTLQRYVAVGRGSRQGQACMGYRFNLTVGALRGQGILWIARATALPVEEDAVSSMALGKGRTRLVVRTTQLWSHWNDPRLTIPTVTRS